jgi:hypothetical protein
VCSTATPDQQLVTAGSSRGRDLREGRPAQVAKLSVPVPAVTVTETESPPSMIEAEPVWPRGSENQSMTASTPLTSERLERVGVRVLGAREHPLHLPGDRLAEIQGIDA